MIISIREFLKWRSSLVAALVFFVLGETSDTTRIFSMAWNTDGTILAVAGIFEGQRGVQLLDAEKQLLRELDIPDGAISVSWNPAGDKLATFGSDTYTIWNANSGEVIVAFEQLGGTEDFSVYWNPTDPKEIATVSGQAVLIRDANTGVVQKVLDAPSGLPDAILSVGWGLDGQTLYTVSTDDVIRVWNTGNSTLQAEFFLGYGVAAATTNTDATKLAIADYESRIRIYEADSAVLLSELETFPLLATRGSLLDLTWSPDGTQIGGSDSEGILIWDISTGSLLNTFPVQHAGSGLSVTAFHPDGYVTYPDTDGSIVNTPQRPDANNPSLRMH